MPSFTFTTSGGQRFTVNAPNGTTEAQARDIFDQQYNTGSLNTVGIGQTVAGLSKSASQALTTIAGLSTVQLTDAVSKAQILKQIPASINVGSLDTKQVTTLLGQTASLVNQSASIATVAKGIGQFGLTPKDLEQQGFLKLGTVTQFIGNSPTADFTKILQSPTVWTGKSGINGLDSFLGNQSIQSITQQNILSTGLSQLKTLGIVNGTESAQTLSGLVQGASKFGAGTVAEWTKGLAPSNIVGSLTNLAKGAQFAVSLVGSLFGKGSTRSVTPASGTANRTALDNAIVSFLGNSRIPPPVYGPVKRDTG